MGARAEINTYRDTHIWTHLDNAFSYHIRSIKITERSLDFASSKSTKWLWGPERWLKGHLSGSLKGCMS